MNHKSQQLILVETATVNNATTNTKQEIEDNSLSTSSNSSTSSSSSPVSSLSSPQLKNNHQTDSSIMNTSNLKQSPVKIFTFQPQNNKQNRSKSVDVFVSDQYRPQLPSQPVPIKPRTITTLPHLVNQNGHQLRQATPNGSRNTPIIIRERLELPQTPIPPNARMLSTPSASNLSNCNINKDVVKQTQQSTSPSSSSTASSSSSSPSSSIMKSTNNYNLQIDNVVPSSGIIVPALASNVLIKNLSRQSPPASCVLLHNESISVSFILLFYCICLCDDLVFS